MTFLWFLSAALAAILFWNAFAGRFEGDRPERSLRLSVGRYYLHVHHWLYCLALMAVFYCADMSGGLTYGFLSGSVVQGLGYRDWYLVLYEKNRGEELYAAWTGLGPPPSRSDA